MAMLQGGGMQTPPTAEANRPDLQNLLNLGGPPVPAATEGGMA